MNPPELTSGQRIHSLAPRVATAGRIIVYLFVLRVVFVVWRSSPEPFNLLVLVVPGLLFLIDGDLRESVVGAGPAVRGRVQATAGVAFAATVGAIGIGGMAQTSLAYPFVRPVAAAATVVIVAVTANFIRRKTEPDGRGVVEGS